MTRGKPNRRDLSLPVELWGTIMGAVDKLTWLERVDECIAAGMVPHAFAHVAIRLATQMTNRRTGLAWPSPETLGAAIGMSASNVRRGFEAAVEVRLIEIVQPGRRGRGSHTTIYRLTMPRAKIEKQLAQIAAGGDLNDAGRSPQISTGGDLDEVRKSPKTPAVNRQKHPPQIATGGDDLPVRDNYQRNIEHGEAAVCSADADRESASTASATISNAPPIKRALALIDDPFGDHQPPHSRDDLNTGTPANASGADAEPGFADVLREYPADCIGDEAKAYWIFDDDLAGWSPSDVVKAVAEFVRERGADDFPPLADALMIIARRQVVQERTQ
ncbi:hypothetical protein [Bradyrhizobium sp. McL0616]|uniref:hypothetical protein n=1 Tax=Bradyrhizobium sp. McL0616 TaxID=3415674 RepID=UPI003CED719D